VKSALENGLFEALNFSSQWAYFVPADGNPGKILICLGYYDLRCYKLIAGLIAESDYEP
jgi:hypothetical protein